MKKKKFVVLASALVLALSVLGGCGQKEDNGDYSQYVTLGDYSNLQVTKNHTTATEENIREIREEELSEYEEYEDVEEASYGNYVDCAILIKEGEQVVYDFTGEDNSYEFILGNAEFGSELDAQLIGKKVGDKLNFSTTVEAGFDDKSMAGKTLSFEVEVFGVQKVVYPDITAEFVSANYDFSTVDEWNDYIAQTAQDNIDKEDEMKFRDDLTSAFTATCTFNGYSDALYQKILAMYEDEYAYYAEMFGSSVDEMYELFETTHAEVEAQAMEECKAQMALEVLMTKENITLTDEEYNEKINQTIIEEGYDSVEDFEADYDKEEIRMTFARDKAIDFLAEKAIITVIEK